MKQLENKKVSFTLILFSLLMLVFGVFTKDHNNLYYRKKKISPPLEVYNVDLFGLEVSFKAYLLFFIIILGIGIYLFVFKNDLTNRVPFASFFQKLKSSYLKYEGKNTKIQQENIINLQSNKHQKTVEVVTFLSLLFTFYLAIELGYSICFFVTLSYFYLLVLKPKSVSNVILKAVFYPLIFVIILNGLTHNDNYSIQYNVSRFILQYLITTAIIIFTQLRKLKKGYEFNFKHPLFWASLISLITGVLSLLVNL